jgi:hypothetical protein
MLQTSGKLLKTGETEREDAAACTFSAARLTLGERAQKVKLLSAHLLLILYPFSSLLHFEVGRHLLEM